VGRFDFDGDFDVDLRDVAAFLSLSSMGSDEDVSPTLGDGEYMGCTASFCVAWTRERIPCER
jgi:hypothetical protein